MGNTQISAGLYNAGILIWNFRSNTDKSLKELMTKIKAALRIHKILLKDIIGIGISSVVPSLNETLISLCIKNFMIEPLFINAINTNYIDFTKYPKPLEIGADLVAASVATIKYSSLRNRLIIDLGTTTTVSVINNINQFLGGVILPGIKVQIQGLVSSTAQLESCSVTRPKKFLGKNTKQAIQSGIYYGNLGAINFLVNNLAKEVFMNQKYQVIITGGLSYLYKDHYKYDLMLQNLVLEGILQILIENEL